MRGYAECRLELLQKFFSRVLGMVNPRSKHATRHKFLLKRLIKCLRSAWGMIIEMEPTAHLSYSNPKQPDVAAANIGRRHRRLVADLKLTSSLASKGKDAAGDGELGWKGAYVRFGNTEPGLLNLVKGRGKYSPSGATAAVVAEEEEEAEAEAEEAGAEEGADAPTGSLKTRLHGDYRFAREEDCELRLFDFERRLWKG